jgi:hypothetical protein
MMCSGGQPCVVQSAHCCKLSVLLSLLAPSPPSHPCPFQWLASFRGALIAGAAPTGGGAAAPPRGASAAQALAAAAPALRPTSTALNARAAGAGVYGVKPGWAVGRAASAAPAVKRSKSSSAGQQRVGRGGAEPGPGSSSSSSAGSASSAATDSTASLGAWLASQGIVL